MSADYPKPPFQEQQQPTSFSCGRLLPTLPGIPLSLPSALGALYFRVPRLSLCDGGRGDHPPP